jgi:hypothetical protein
LEENLTKKNVVVIEHDKHRVTGKPTKTTRKVLATSTLKHSICAKKHRGSAKGKIWEFEKNVESDPGDHVAKFWKSNLRK